jgi:hypothetical protein
MPRLVHKSNLRRAPLNSTLVTAHEACRVAHISYPHMRKLQKAGEFPQIVATRGRTTLYALADVCSWRERRDAAAEERRGS